MATVEHAIVNTDLMTGTDVRSQMRSFRYGTYDDTKKTLTGVAIDNGNLVKLTRILDGNQDLWMAETPAATTPLNEICIVATPEIMYDERENRLEDFYNEAEKNSTGLRLVAGDIFGATAPAWDGTPAVDKFAVLMAGTKIKVADAAPTGTNAATLIGKIINTRLHNGKVFYNVEVGRAS